MATSNPTLQAIHGALSELRRAPLMYKAPAAETLATLTLTLLTEFDRRIGALEARATERAAHCVALHDRLDAIERRGNELGELAALERRDQLEG